MEITILAEKNYLVLPFGSGAAFPRVLRIYRDGVLQDDLRIRLDYVSPQFKAYYPLSRFRGERLTLDVSPDMELRDIQTDTPDYSEADGYPFRPEWHFTARFAWINDPNGLVEYTSPVTGERTYHLFYQHGPYDTVWNNLHWGHAVSSDLMHWEHRPIALYPDGNGSMFSGSAIVDRKNLLGLKEGGEDVIALFYTSAGGESEMSKGRRYTQSLAYSTDGGRTFKKYEGNPILPSIEDMNRDPKVIWFEKLRCYIMALYLSEKEKYALFRSDDLINWERFQTVDLEGDTECPDLYPLRANGDSEDVKWVFNGAKFHYLVCDWDGESFRPVQEMRKLVYGTCFYAAQTFSDISDGRRIGIAWEKGIAFPAPNPFASQLSIPYELTLRKLDAQYYLCAQPVEEIRSVYGHSDTFKQIRIGPGQAFTAKLNRSAYDISLSLGEVETGRLRLMLFGHRIDIDPLGNTVTFANKTVMPFSASGAEKSLRIVADRCSMELFTDGGTSMAAVSAVCDYNLCGLSITSEAQAVIEELAIHKLKAN